MATEAAAAQVILNAAPAPEEGKRWREGQWEDVGAMLRAADVLCVNETEAEKLAGLPVAGRAGAELDAAVAAAADRLHAMVRGARGRRDHRWPASGSCRAGAGHRARAAAGCKA